jgi:hypothetical protein
MVNYYSYNTEKVLKCIFSVFFLFFFLSKGHTQYWERFYGIEDYDEIFMDLQETYDKGYVISAIETLDYTPEVDRIVSIIKTDINGEILWKRVVDKHGIATRGCKPLSDGSLVCTSGYWDEINEMWKRNLV